jgi:hypothetical protein
MRRRLLALAMLAAAIPAGAQRPDFSGTWVRQDSVAGPTRAATGDASFRRGDMGSGWGTPITVTQAANKLTVVFDVFTTYDLQPKTRFTYNLDSTETKNAIVYSHEETPVRSWARWNGNALEIITRFPVPPGVPARGATPDLVQVLSLDANGRLIVDARRSGAGGAVNSVVTTYTKR